MFNIQMNIIKELDQLKGFEFELFLYFLFQRLGHKARITPRSHDFGVDVIIDDDIAIQAKRNSPSSMVCNKAVQEASTGKLYYGCKEGMVITTSFFSQPAIKLAESVGVKLIDRDILVSYFFKNNIKSLDEVLPDEISTANYYKKLTVPTTEKPTEKPRKMFIPTGKSRLTIEEKQKRQETKVLKLKDQIKYYLCENNKDTRIRYLVSEFKFSPNDTIEAMQALVHEEWLTPPLNNRDGYGIVFTNEMKLDFLSNYEVANSE